MKIRIEFDTDKSDAFQFPVWGQEVGLVMDRLGIDFDEFDKAETKTWDIVCPSGNTIGKCEVTD